VPTGGKLILILRKIRRLGANVDQVKIILSKIAYYQVNSLSGGEASKTKEDWFPCRRNGEKRRKSKVVPNVVIGKEGLCFWSRDKSWESAIRPDSMCKGKNRPLRGPIVCSIWVKNGTRDDRR